MELSGARTVCRQLASVAERTTRVGAAFFQQMFQADKLRNRGQQTASHIHRRQLKWLWSGSIPPSYKQWTTTCFRSWKVQTCTCKTRTIHRMELTAVVTAVRLGRMLPTWHGRAHVMSCVLRRLQCCIAIHCERPEKISGICCQSDSRFLGNEPVEPHHLWTESGRCGIPRPHSGSTDQLMCLFLGPKQDEIFCISVNFQ